MRKIIKLFLFVLPFFIAVFMILSIFNGKTDDIIISFLNKMDDSIEDEKINIIYKDGKIDLMSSFEFYIEPKVEYYDFDNKLSISNFYGVTQNEVDFRKSYTEKVNANDNEGSNSLPKELRGNLRFNNDNVKKVSEEFDIKSQHLKGTVTNVNISYKIDRDEIKNFYGEYKNITKYLTEDDELTKMKIITKKINESGEKIEQSSEMEVCYVTVEIAYKSYCEWIQQTDLCPKLLYLNEFDDKLEKMGLAEGEGYFSESEMVSLSSNDFVSFSPRLNTGSMDANKVITNYPMIKGEECKIKVGYIIPVEYLDKCYIWYNYITVDNSYNALDDVIVKIK